MSLKLFANLLFKTVNNVTLHQYNCTRGICTSATLYRSNDWKRHKKSIPKVDEGNQGETSVVLDTTLNKISIFPDENLPNRIFFGTQFKDLPVVNIKTTPNNTIINVTNANGNCIFINSCGIEGFKNTRKGTNIAAQATATSLAARALERGLKHVRVTIQGLGPGRMSAIKGLQIAGMNIISITDATRVSWNPPRPRKARRL